MSKMATEKRLIYLEDAVSLLEKDIAENKDALKYTYHGDKEAICSEIVGTMSAITILKQHASHGGTVDAVEVVHGRWIPGKSMALSDKCSVCHGWVTRHSVNERKHRYCPNCGAKMDGGA